MGVLITMLELAVMLNAIFKVSLKHFELGGTYPVNETYQNLFVNYIEKTNMKMNELKKHFLNLLTPILILWGIEATFFLCMPYDKGIISTILYGNVYNVVGEIIFRLLFYIIFFSEVYILFFKYIYGSPYSFSIKNPIVIFTKLTLLRILIDLVNCIIYQLTNDIIGELGSIATEMLFIFLVFYQVVKFISINGCKLVFNKLSQKFIISSLFLLCCVTIYFIVQYNVFLSMQNKYIASSDILRAYSQNYNFYIKIAVLIIICIFYALSFSYFYFSYSDDKNISSNREQKHSGIINILIKVLAVSFCVIIFACVKSVIYPIGSIKIIPDITGSTSNLNEELKSFGKNYTNVKLSRFSDYKFNNEYILNKTFVDVTYQNKVILNISYESPVEDNLNYLLKDIDTKYTEYDKIIGTSNIMNYNNFGIVFLDNDIPCGVKINQIANHRENKILTEAVKN